MPRSSGSVPVVRFDPAPEEEDLCLSDGWDWNREGSSAGSLAADNWAVDIVAVLVVDLKVAGSIAGLRRLRGWGSFGLLGFGRTLRRYYSDEDV